MGCGTTPQQRLPSAEDGGVDGGSGAAGSRAGLSPGGAGGVRSGRMNRLVAEEERATGKLRGRGLILAALLLPIPPSGNGWWGPVDHSRATLRKATQDVNLFLC